MIRFIILVPLEGEKDSVEFLLSTASLGCGYEVPLRDFLRRWFLLLGVSVAERDLSKSCEFCSFVFTLEWKLAEHQCPCPAGQEGLSLMHYQ